MNAWKYCCKVFDLLTIAAVSILFFIYLVTYFIVFYIILFFAIGKPAKGNKKTLYKEKTHEIAAFIFTLSLRHVLIMIIIIIIIIITGLLIRDVQAKS